MTDPISPAEAATANAIDAANAASATTAASLAMAASNADLISGVPAALSDAEKIAKVQELEKQLHDLQEGKAVAAGLAIPHAQHVVPAAQVHHAGDTPVVHAAPMGSAPPVEKSVAPSARLAEMVNNVPPVKRKYAYQRNKR